MAVDDTAASPLDAHQLLEDRCAGRGAQAGPGGHLVGGGGAVEPRPTSRSRSAPSRTACRGRFLWLVPERDLRECVLGHGHGGDHRDAAGYPWNDERWSD